MPSVKNAWIRDYGEIEGLKKWNEFKGCYGRTNVQHIEKYGEDFVRNLTERKKTFSLESCISRYGEVDGPIKWNERLSKKLKSQYENHIETGQRNGQSLVEFQNRYGIEDGYVKWDNKCKHHAYMVSKQRYIDQYGLEKGSEICHKIKDTLSIVAFINRYGEVDGKIEYEKHCKKCGITKEKMILKYGEVVGIEKFESWKEKSIMNITSVSPHSKISQLLFWEIYEQLPESSKSDCYFGELNSEYMFYINNKNIYPNSVIMVDFKLGNVIIEFDGEYWHRDKCDIDKMRDDVLSNLGYSILRISDKNVNYKTIDLTSQLKQCMEFINENAQPKSK